MFSEKSSIQLNIRGKLTIQFALIVATILILFSLAVYTLSSTYRKNEFYGRLKDKALTTAKLLIEVNEVDEKLLKIIDKNTATVLPEEKIAVYNYEDEEIYSSGEKLNFEVTSDLLDDIRLEEELWFSRDEKEVLGLLYSDKYNRFVVIASGFDKFGKQKLKNLRIVLASGLFVSILIIVVAGWIFSGRAMKPISNVVTEVDKISISNIGSRLSEGNGKDEIAKLSITFNQMLDRLEEAFELQKSFVSNASHEMRTPLTAITGQIEVALINRRDLDEYEKILKSLLEDIRSLNKLTNGLLNLTHAGLDISKLKLFPVRVDELLFECEQDIKKSNPGYTISITFKDPEEIDESQFTINGNEQLLKIALSNIMENGCKYSKDKRVNVTLMVAAGKIYLHFTDNGIGIPNEELTRIFEPFYRAHNARSIKGHGIGLSLTKKIIELHNGRISVNSVVNNGTTIIVVL